MPKRGVHHEDVAGVELDKPRAALCARVRARPHRHAAIRASGRRERYSRYSAVGTACRPGRKAIDVRRQRPVLRLVRKPQQKLRVRPFLTLTRSEGSLDGGTKLQQVGFPPQVREERALGAPSDLLGCEPAPHDLEIQETEGSLHDVVGDQSAAHREAGTTGEAFIEGVSSLALWGGGRCWLVGLSPVGPRGNKGARD